METELIKTSSAVEDGPARKGPTFFRFSHESVGESSRLMDEASG